MSRYTSAQLDEIADRLVHEAIDIYTLHLSAAKRTDQLAIGVASSEIQACTGLARLLREDAAFQRNTERARELRLNRNTGG